MSAVTDVAPVLRVEAETNRSRRSEAGLAAAIRVELAKLTSQLLVRIALALCVVVPLAFAVGMRLESSRPADTLFGRWAGTTGFATSLTVLNWAAIVGAPVLAGLFAGDIFASEDRLDTWKTILTRSCTRTHLFVAKGLAATLCVWLGFAAAAVVSVVAGLAIVGSAPLVGLSGQLIAPSRALGLVLASWAVCLLWTTAFVALGLLLSIATRSGIVGVLGPLVVAIALQLFEVVTSGEAVRSILLSTPTDAWHALFTEPVHIEPIVQAVLTSVAYTALFGGTAWWLLRRRDFVGADAVPANRVRITLRIAIPALAIGAVLAALSGVGPTALTARRLNVSVAQTFGNLSEVRYHWQTGAAADTAIPWHAACDRGGVAAASGGTPISTGNANDKGPGDDWQCIVTDLRASDGVGPTTLDVNLKANGCYQAQSPPGAVGSLYVDSERGKTFLNPLYAFDGCFGTS